MLAIYASTLCCRDLGHDGFKAIFEAQPSSTLGLDML